MSEREVVSEREKERERSFRGREREREVISTETERERSFPEQREIISRERESALRIKHNCSCENKHKSTHRSSARSDGQNKSPAPRHRSVQCTS